MRTRGGYNQQAAFVANDPASASVYGVKKQSILNRSNFFHVVDGLPSDIMHDMLEGVIPLHVKVMLRKFVVAEKLFSLDELNKRLLGFPFGDSDSRNRPSSINNLNADHHMRQSGTHTCTIFYSLLLQLHFCNFGQFLAVCGQIILL